MGRAAECVFFSLGLSINIPGLGFRNGRWQESFKFRLDCSRYSIFFYIFFSAEVLGGFSIGLG